MLSLNAARAAQRTHPSVRKRDSPTARRRRRAPKAPCAWQTAQRHARKLDEASRLWQDKIAISQ
jgi:hypothetical protein